MLRHPRRQTNVGPANPVIVAGFRLFPAVYDAIVTPALRTFGLAPWQGLATTAGNVDDPQHPPPGTTSPQARPTPTTERAG